jgi:hypothetical protein
MQSLAHRANALRDGNQHKMKKYTFSWFDSKRLTGHMEAVYFSSLASFENYAKTKSAKWHLISVE